MRYYLTIICSLAMLVLMAQPKAELDLFLAGSAYYGDLLLDDRQPDYDFARFSPGLRFGYAIHPQFLVRAGLQYAQLAGDETNSAQEDLAARGYSFSSNLIEGNLQLVWEPFAERRYPAEGGYRNILSPYLFAGLGLTHNNPTTDFGSVGVDGVPERVKMDQAAMEKTALQLPFGGGLRVDLSPHLSLGVELGARKVFTDYLDGVSASGNADKQDWYVLGGVTVGYRWHVQDYDRDGFLDDEDRCLQAAGPDYAQGCPDSDGDGLEDELDQCPYQKGSLDTRGCPDQDFDKVPDLVDECPDYPGHPSANGCLDSDGDGLRDDDDMCPFLPGKDLSGCPDADGDGVEDPRDRCPNLAGPGEQAGCPQADQDADGTPDAEDACPDLPGSRATQGCPDTDADGVLDSEDVCPDIKGLAINKGCPAISEAVQATLAFMTEAVQFESGSDQLLADSKVKLNDLVQIMEDYPYYQLQIAGHTDSRGQEDANLQLSQARAKACFDYLSTQGVAAARMQHQGYGETQPVADNDTTVGRRKNRRVVFELVLE